MTPPPWGIMTILRILVLLVACACPLTAARPDHAPDGGATRQRNVIFVIADGVRWQEVFRGADTDMMTTANGVTRNREDLLRRFDAETTAARRERLMPFLWTHVARGGQLHGNRDLGSEVSVANRHRFSYPGFSELLCGFADDERVNSNKKTPNPNASVFEWLAGKPGFGGRVAAFAAWDVVPFIFNAERCGFPVDGGDRPFLPPTGVTCGMAMVNEIRSTTPYRWAAAFDSLVFPMCAEYLRDQKPRALFLGLGEPDEWGHEGDYGRYLEAVHRTDAWLARLWEMTQAMPEYRDNTTFLFATDHGRGDNTQNPKTWNSHGRDYDGSEAVFIAVWGPDTPARGEVSGGAALTLSQTAATVAAAVGHDYPAEQPRAATPVPGAVARGADGR